MSDCLQSHLKKLKENLSFYAYECSACIGVCAPRACLMSEKANQGFESPGTGVTDVVSHWVGIGNRTWGLCKNNKLTTDPTFHVLQCHLKNIVIVCFISSFYELFSDSLPENSGPLAPCFNLDPQLMRMHFLKVPSGCACAFPECSASFLCRWIFHKPVFPNNTAGLVTLLILYPLMKALLTNHLEQRENLYFDIVPKN